MNKKKDNFYVLGKGPSLVILPGWSKTKEDYKELATLLSKKYTVYVLDLPGFGGVEIDRAYSLRDYCGYVENFVKGQKISSPILLGHSFGGRVALKIALTDHKFASRLILVNSAGIERKSLKTIILKSGAIIVPSRVKELLRPMLGSKDYLQSFGFVRETFKKIVSQDLEPELSKVKTNTLLIWGEKDNTTPLAYGKIMHEKIAHSKLEIVPGGDHGIPYRMAGRVAEIILAHS